MEQLKKFIQNRQAVNVTSTLLLFFLSAFFLLAGIFNFNIIFEVLSLSDLTLYRLWSIVFGVGILVIAYALYIQNKSAVDESLAKARAKVAMEAKELAKTVEDKVDGQENKGAKKTKK